jgi:hypothetical protein
MKSKVKKITYRYDVFYRSNGTWIRYGSRDNKKDAEALGSNLVKKSYIADFYKIEKVKINK